MANQQLIPLSVRDAFQDKNILAIGSTGFLGKVWLAMLLEQVQTFRKIYILIRGKGTQTGKDRFEQFINTSYVFQTLHDKFNNLESLLREKIVVVDGDVNEHDLGLSEKAAHDLAEKIDVVVNFAGLVDFNPDLRDAFDVNVQGAMNVASFTGKCRQKKLVHISTCYVAGIREGSVEEKVYTNESPNGKKIDTTYELTWIESNSRRIEEEFNSQEKIEAARKLIRDRGNVHHKKNTSENRISRTVENIKRKKLREAMIQLGKDHAQELGWTNTYTYTKGLAEIILKQHFPQIELVIFRPSIVESSLSFPFAGWNEGFNTSGPLAYLMKTWFRHLPLSRGNPFDVIPVDFVSRGLTVATAALLKGVHREVYQCSTSDVNRLTIDQACYFTSESHSEYYKKYGTDWKERFILSRWKTIPSRKDHILSTGNMKKFFKKLQNGLEKFKIVKSACKPIHSWALRSSRNLERTERLLELFYPFIHDYTHIFWTRSLFLYDIAEPEFRFSIDQIQWENYWKDVHMPGLRRWCFPMIEGKPVEKFVPKHPISFAKSSGNGHTNGSSRVRPDDEDTIPIRPRNQETIPETEEKISS